MTFDKPFFLFFFLLSPLPFLIYFSIKLRRKVIKFPSLIIFKNLGLNEIRRINYLKYVVLVLRSIFFILLIIAFAKPHSEFEFLNKFGKYNKKIPLSMVILLDNSYSMATIYDGLSVLTRNINALTKILAYLDENSRVAILSFSDMSTLVSDFISPREALEKIKNYNKILYNGTNYREVFQKACEILKAEKNKKIIFLASDNSLNGMQSHFNLPHDILSFAIESKGKPLNFWFEDIKVLQSNDLTVKIKGTLLSSEIFTGNVKLRYCDYFSCGNWRNVPFYREEKKEFEFIFKSKNNCGYVEISEDNLTNDNKYYVCFSQKAKKILVLYSGKDIFIRGKAAFFVKELLEVLSSQNAGYNLDYKNVETFNSNELRNYTMIIEIIPYSEPVVGEIVSHRIPFIYIPANFQRDASIFSNKPFYLNGRVLKGDYFISEVGLHGIYLNEFYAVEKYFEHAFNLEIESSKRNKYPAVVKLYDYPSYFFTFNLDINNSNFVIKPIFMNILKQIIFSDKILSEKNDFFIGQSPPLKEETRQFYYIGKDFLKLSETKFICTVPGNYMIDYEDGKFYFSCNLNGKKKEGSLKKIEKTLWRNLSEKDYLSEFYKAIYSFDISAIFLLCAIFILMLENLILWRYF